MRLGGTGRVMRLIALSDGENSPVVYVEVPPGGGGERLELIADEKGGTVLKAAQSLSDQLASVGDFLTTIYGQIAKLEYRPSELEVEFGVKLGLEAGLVIAKGSSEASIVVRAKWVRLSPE